MDNNLFIEPKVGVVIPVYKIPKDTLIQVIRTIPEGAAHIIVVDDDCPRGSAAVAEGLGQARVTVLRNERNLGVGGAVIAGYRKALALGCEIVVKMDGDGQMDPAHFDRLIEPLLNHEADYAKGNRFRDFKALARAPRMRLFGNSILSFLVKIASGYWNIIDPTNGYTAIHRDALARLELDKLSQRYFFESDMLISLGLAELVVRDVDMPARYGSEESSMSLWRVALDFPALLLRGLGKRILFKYFIFDFNMASVYLLIGLPMFSGSMIFGLIEWWDSVATSTPKSAGTIMLAALPIIVSFQMLLQAVQIDIDSVPRKRK
jgi:glycosyltransferase involved in cell wall biosynthesis